MIAEGRIGRRAAMVASPATFRCARVRPEVSGHHIDIGQRAGDSVVRAPRFCGEGRPRCRGRSTHRWCSWPTPISAPEAHPPAPPVGRYSRWWSRKGQPIVEGITEGGQGFRLLRVRFAASDLASGDSPRFGVSTTIMRAPLLTTGLEACGKVAPKVLSLRKPGSTAWPNLAYRGR